MIAEISLVAAISVAAYEYVTNAKFKAAVQAEVASTQQEVSKLRTKAASGVAVVDTDFAKVEAVVISLVSKL